MKALTQLCCDATCGVGGNVGEPLLQMQERDSFIYPAHLATTAMVFYDRTSEMVDTSAHKDDLLLAVS